MYEPHLIKEVKKYPFLFDKKNPEYRVKLSRAQAWKAIGATLGEPPYKCKARWRTLKDKFIKESKEGEENEASRWKHHSAMSFLYDYLDLRRRPSYRSGADVQDSYVDESYEAMLPNERTITFLTPNGAGEETLDSYMDESIESISSNETINRKPNIQQVFLEESPGTIPHKKKKIASFDFMSCETTQKRHAENQHQLTDVMVRLTNMVERLLLESEHKGDGFYKFLSSILSKVDARSQDRIKMELLNLASERVDEILSMEAQLE